MRRNVAGWGPAAARGAEERGEERASWFVEEGCRRADEKKEKKGEGVEVCRCVLVKGREGSLPSWIKWLNWFNIVIRIDLIDISIHIPDLVAALGGILPPGCGTLSPARRLTLVRDQCLSG